MKTAEENTAHQPKRKKEKQWRNEESLVKEAIINESVMKAFSVSIIVANNEAHGRITRRLGGMRRLWQPVARLAWQWLTGVCS